MWEVSSPSPSTAAPPPLYRLPPTQLEKSIPPTLANIYSIYPINNIFLKGCHSFIETFIPPYYYPPLIFEFAKDGVKIMIDKILFR